MNSISLEQAFKIGWTAFMSRPAYWLLLATPSVLSSAINSVVRARLLVVTPATIWTWMAVIVLVSWIAYVIGTVQSLRDVGVLTTPDSDAPRYGRVAWVMFIVLVVVGAIGLGVGTLPYTIGKSLDPAFFKPMMMASIVLDAFVMVAFFVFFLIVWPYSLIAAEESHSFFALLGKAAEMTRGYRGMLFVFFIIRFLLNLPLRYTYGITDFIMFPLVTLASASIYGQMKQRV